ncbi:F-box domain-containing protein [Brazilian cedratvirus IHUMI]|uniref:F-box domain-containing protein n=1 Tax=Brazilian cedratvirus IHUMI TaxID=2126980 RepID=A0A2R8FEX8_9VIRU|nr:F-box domain-containing protein [Brazilian cedratvirus IHUMI]
MEEIPTEVDEKILLLLPLPDLLSRCSVDQESRKFCSSDFFWSAKFRNEGLSLLEQGQTVQEWAAIYTNSLLARDVAELYANRSYSFPLTAVQDINLLLVDGIKREQLAPFYFSGRLSKTRDDLREQLPFLGSVKQRRRWRQVYDNIKSKDHHTVILDGVSSRFSISQLQTITITSEEEGYDFEDLNNNTIRELVTVLEVDLSPEDVKELFYRLVYFNVDLKHIPTWNFTEE